MMNFLILCEFEPYLKNLFFPLSSFYWLLHYWFLKNNFDKYVITTILLGGFLISVVF